MILNFAEGSNPGYGYMPISDGAYWQARPTQIFSQVTAVTLTAAATASVVSLTNCAGSPTLAAGLLNRVGATLVVKFGGYMTTAASAQGNLTLGIYLGGSCVATTKATALAASQTTIGYYGECRLTVLTTGASGTIQPTGFVALASLSAVIDPVITAGTTIGTQAPSTPPTVAFTNSLLVDIQSVLSASTNTLVNTNATIEIVF
jgi:hypothetical protein